MFDICLVATAGSNWEQQWSYLLSHFSPRNLYVIGDLDRRVRPFTTYTSVETAEEIPGRLVVLAPESGRYIQGDIALHDFQHPSECCYLFGSDSANLTEEQLGTRTPDDVVYIQTDTHDQMYSFMAGAIVLYDRRVRVG